MKTRALILIACISLIAAAAFAHGDEQHVIGTVASVAKDSITVKTTANALVTVAVVPQTTSSFTRKSLPKASSWRIRSNSARRLRSRLRAPRSKQIPEAAEALDQGFRRLSRRPLPRSVSSNKYNG